MRLTRIVIVSLFIFFFAFGIQTQVFAQAACTPQTQIEYPPGSGTIIKHSDCVNGGAGYFYGHQAACQILTCSASYIPGAFVSINKDIKSYVCGVAAGYGKTCTSQGDPVLSMNLAVFNSLVSTHYEAGVATQIGGYGLTANGEVVFGPPPKNTEMAFYNGGALGTLTNAAGSVAVIPVSTSDYIADLRDTIQNPLGAQPAYAQGLGFSALRPVLGLWKLFRNVAYFFFVIIFIVIGFLIMFRSKISGQAAVTIQQALPKIIVSLLLVTFSYAIAGLMIDVMYLIIYLMIGIFSAGGSGTLTVSSLTTIALSNNIFKNVTDLIAPQGGTSVIGTIGGQINSAVTDMLTGSGWANVNASLAGLGANLIFTLVMLVALLVNMFRVFFALLMAYVMVIFAVIFAPIQLLFGAIPGQNTFSAWLKGLLENLMVFPVVIFLLLCAQYFTHAPGGFGAAGQGGFAPPQLGLQQGASSSFVLAILQFGILALIPKAVEIAKGAVNGKLNLDPAKAMGEFYKSGKLGQTLGTGIIGGIAGTALGGGIGAVVGAARAKPGENRLLAARKGAGTGAAVGGVAGAFSPIAAPYAVRTVRSAVTGAASAFGQGTIGGLFEERSRKADLKKQDELAKQGADTTVIPK